MILQSYCTDKKGAIFYASQCRSGPDTQHNDADTKHETEGVQTQRRS